MSDDYHRPTLTFPNGAYNATQVRLYGISAGVAVALPGHRVPIGGNGMFVEGVSHRGRNSTLITQAEAVLDAYDTTEKRIQFLSGVDVGIAVDPNDKETLAQFGNPGFATTPEGNIFVPFPEIPIKVAFHLSSLTRGFGSPVVASVNDSYLFGRQPDRKVSCGIMVGYAYEGHTYDLPKPKIMIVPAYPEPIPPDDSGYDAKAGEGYAVWLVDKLDQCVEWEMNQGFVEQLVLDANMPGRRSPTMYAAKMMMGHRGGRLND